MQNISVYLNQRASNTSFHYWKERISKSLFRSKIDFKTPATLDELYSNLSDDIEKDVDAVVSVGGDGTANTIIQSLAGTDIGLLVIPGGTANDLASQLGNKDNVKKVIQCIRNKEQKHMDLIRVNERFMATNGGIGLGSEVAEKINKIRSKYPLFKNVMKMSGKNIYSFFVVQELLSVDFDYYNLSIESDEFNDNVKAATILINNQPMLAGTFNIAPQTRNDDGNFNVSILTHSSRARLVQCIYNISQGQVPTNDPDFISFETKGLKIKNLEPQKPVNFFGDGEIFPFDESDGPVNEWHIAIERLALKVYSREADCGLVDFSTEVSLQ